MKEDKQEDNIIMTSYSIESQKRKKSFIAYRATRNEKCGCDILTY